MPADQGWSLNKGNTPECLKAQAVGAAFSAGVTLPIRLTAPTLEPLQHEAREVLIEVLGSTHGTARVRVRRHPDAGVSRMRPARSRM